MPTSVHAVLTVSRVNVPRRMNTCASRALTTWRRPVPMRRLTPTDLPIRLRSSKDDQIEICNSTFPGYFISSGDTPSYQSSR